MSGLFVSLGVMFWIVTGAQLALNNNEVKFSEKNVSIAGCPTNLNFKNQTTISG